MSDSLVLNPIKFVNGNVVLPGSKSISNRVILLSSLSKGITNIKNLLNSEDTQHMLNALKIVGVSYFLSKDKKSCQIYGNGTNFLKQKKTINLFLGNAGTAIRPLISLFSLYKNEIFITGDNSMKNRPIEHLVDALRQGGAEISYERKKNYPPVLVKGGFIGGKIELKGNVSSQFLTSILIMAPLAILNTKIEIIGNLVSKPYVEMTIKLMKIFGVNIINNNYKSFFIKGNSEYKTPGVYEIEGDASSASYFLAAGAIKGGTVTVHGVGKNSIQGDIYFAKVLKKIGAVVSFGENFISCSKGELKSVNLDLNNIPDAAMTVAIISLFCSGTTCIKNIYNWKVKETNRLKAMANELRKIGATVKQGNDYLIITPPKKFLYSAIETYNDHRIAMCFSLIALSNVSTKIINPNCVNKTFPNYFKELSSISHY
ncbi:3-phosphoshikimate 1-carboxyvinyltransferase [Buchnera aphidicola (Tetraneura ulmi)]|uniref:3-phosphoshikimate 1-carboxyvinyltransferase n=1 Tax=Buchnera aphidicola TaxID=9 RepID=UPI003464257F